MAKYQDVPRVFKRGFLNEIDGRTSIGQWLRAQHDAYVNDLGGESELSWAQMALVEHALWLHYWMHLQNQALANGNDVDISKWTSAANTLQGLLNKLGLERVAKPVPSLSDYIKKGDK